MNNIRVITLVTAGVLTTVSAGAQAVEATRTGTACTYHRCALSIAPAWNGLALEKGEARERVANLGFFWPHSLGGVFPGRDSAATYAERAEKVRRGAALLTDAGGLLVAYAVARRLRTGAVDNDVRATVAVGALAFGLSVPLQFAADGHLSRAVWWHNRQYAR